MLTFQLPSAFGRAMTSHSCYHLTVPNNIRTRIPCALCGTSLSPYQSVFFNIRTILHFIHPYIPSRSSPHCARLLNTSRCASDSFAYSTRISIFTYQVIDLCVVILFTTIVFIPPNYSLFEPIQYTVLLLHYCLSIRQLQHCLL